MDSHILDDASIEENPWSTELDPIDHVSTELNQVLNETSIWDDNDNDNDLVNESIESVEVPNVVLDDIQPIESHSIRSTHSDESIVPSTNIEDKDLLSDLSVIENDIVLDDQYSKENDIELDRIDDTENGIVLDKTDDIDESSMVLKNIEQNDIVLDKIDDTKIVLTDSANTDDTEIVLNNPTDTDEQIVLTNPVDISESDISDNDDDFGSFEEQDIELPIFIKPIDQLMDIILPNLPKSTIEPNTEYNPPEIYDTITSTNRQFNPKIQNNYNTRNYWQTQSATNTELKKIINKWVELEQGFASTIKEEVEKSNNNDHAIFKWSSVKNDDSKKKYQSGKSHQDQLLKIAQLEISKLIANREKKEMELLLIQRLKRLKLKAKKPLPKPVQTTIKVQDKNQQTKKKFFLGNFFKFNKKSSISKDHISSSNLNLTDEGQDNLQNNLVDLMAEYERNKSQVQLDDDDDDDESDDETGYSYNNLAEPGAGLVDTSASEDESVELDHDLIISPPPDPLGSSGIVPDKDNETDVLNEELKTNFEPVLNNAGVDTLKPNEPSQHEDEFDEFVDADSVQPEKESPSQPVDDDEFSEFVQSPTKEGFFESQALPLKPSLVQPVQQIEDDDDFDEFVQSPIKQEFFQSQPSQIKQSSVQPIDDDDDDDEFDEFIESKSSPEKSPIQDDDDFDEFVESQSNFDTVLSPTKNFDTVLSPTKVDTKLNPGTNFNTEPSQNDDEFDDVVESEFLQPQPIRQSQPIDDDDFDDFVQSPSPILTPLPKGLPHSIQVNHNTNTDDDEFDEFVSSPEPDPTPNMNQILMSVPDKHKDDLLIDL